jgi:hypothetical protein
MLTTTQRGAVLHIGTDARYCNAKFVIAKQFTWNRSENIWEYPMSIQASAAPITPQAARTRCIINPVGERLGKGGSSTDKGCIVRRIIEMCV